jgi:hypothetical protein
MAKSGRAFADRKKIEALSADKTVEVHDCGTCFPSAGGITITLPAATAAGEGWWIRIVKSDTGGAVSVVATSSLDGIGIDGNANVALSGDFTIHADAGKGSWVEIWCDGSQYYAMGMADDNNGFTA